MTGKKVVSKITTNNPSTAKLIAYKKITDSDTNTITFDNLPQGFNSLLIHAKANVDWPTNRSVNSNLYSSYGGTNILQYISTTQLNGVISKIHMTTPTSYGRILFVINTSTSTIDAYRVNLQGTYETGSLTYVSSYASGTGNFISSNMRNGYDPKILCITNTSANTVRSYLVNTASSSTYGTLTAAAGNPYATGNQPSGVWVSPRLNNAGNAYYVYVANKLDGTVSRYSASSTDASLTSLGTTTIGAGTSGIQYVCGDHNGSFLFISNPTNNYVWSYSINQADGTLTLAGSESTMGSVGFITYNNGYLYGCSSSLSALVTYSVDASGVITKIDGYSTNNGTPLSVMVTNDNLYAYVTTSSGWIELYNFEPVGVYILGYYVSGIMVNTGYSIYIGVNTLTDGLYYPSSNNTYSGLETVFVGDSSPHLNSASSTTTGTNPFCVACHPTGKFVYVTNYGQNNVQAYTINQTTGALTSVGTISTVGNPYGIACDPTGKFVYVVDQTNNNVRAYTINQTTGGLTSIGTTAAGLAPQGVACDPTGKFVYVVNISGNSVQAYTINQTTGALTSLGATSTGVNSNPVSVACDPSGKFVYLVNYYDSTILSYTINQATGALASIGAAISTGVNGNPACITCDPTAKFVYVTNQSAGNVQAYTINQTTGALTYVGANPTGTSPQDVACDPSGKFVYVTNYGDSTISSYIINQTTGALTSMGTSATGQLARGVACEPIGNFVYLVSYPNTVSTYKINKLYLKSYNKNDFFANKFDISGVPKLCLRFNSIGDSLYSSNSIYSNGNIKKWYYNDQSSNMYQLNYNQWKTTALSSAQIATLPLYYSEDYTPWGDGFSACEAVIPEYSSTINPIVIFKSGDERFAHNGTCSLLASGPVTSLSFFISTNDPFKINSVIAIYGI